MSRLNLTYKQAVTRGFRITSNTVVGYKPTRTYGKPVRIPDSVDGVPITEIADYAFYNLDLDQVVLPSKLQVIGDYALSGNRFEELVLPETLSVIGKGAFFRNCLIELKLPDSVREVGPEAFMSNDISTLEFNNNLKIMYGAFADNDLDSVTIGAELEIQGNPFYRNPHVRFESKIDRYTCGFEGESLIDLDKSEMLAGSTETTIPEGVRVIGSYALYRQRVKKLVVPKSVEDIRSFALAECGAEKIEVMNPKLNLISLDVMGRTSGGPTLILPSESVVWKNSNHFMNQMVAK